MENSKRGARYIFICFCVLSLNATAQNQHLVDSLSEKIQSSASKEQKVDALIRLSEEYFYSDTVTFWTYIGQAIELAEKIGYMEGKADAIYTSGRSYILRGLFDHAKGRYIASLQLAEQITYVKGISNSTNGFGHLKIYAGEYDSAIFFYKKAISMLEEEGSIPDALGLSYQNLARAYISKGKYPQAIDYYEQALGLLKEEQKYNIYMGLGSIYYYQGFYVKSQEYQFKALELQEKAGFEKAIAGINGNIANNYAALKNFEKAKEHHEVAIAIFKKNNDQQALALSFNNLAAVLRKMDRLDESEAYLKKAITIYEKGSPNEYLPTCYRNLGEIAMEKGDYIQANTHFKHALALSEQLENEMQIANAMLSIGRAELKLKTYENARKYLYLAIESSERLQSIRNIQDGYRALSELENEVGNYQAAFAAFQQFKAAEDSIHSKENTEEITRIALEHEFQQERDSLSFAQEKATLTYRQKLNKRQWALTGLIVFSILISIIAFLTLRSYQQKKSSNQKLTIANENLRELNQYLKELRKREKELSQAAISSKERELASISMASYEKNTLLKDLEQQLKFIEKRIDEPMRPSFKQLKKTISNGYSMDDSWHSFLHSFQDVHPHFFDKLKNENPQLSNDDLKLSAYLKIGMNNKEIANVTHLTLGSVKTKVNRLKKKLNMTPEDNLRDFMVKFA